MLSICVAWIIAVVNTKVIQCEIMPDNARKICLFALGHWHYAKKCVILCP